MKSASGGSEAAKGLFEREYRSDSNKILDSLARIEQTADKAAKQFGTNIDSIYDALDFDPISYQLDSRNDSWLKETEQYAMEAMRALVTSEHRNYGGTKSLIGDENALTFLGVNIGDKPKTTEGETGEMAEKGIVGGIINWAGRHPYLSAAGLIGIFAGAAGMNAYQSNKKAVDNYVDSGLSKAKAEISAGASGVFVGFGDFFNDAPVASLKIDTPPDKRIAGEKIVFNASGSYDTDGNITEYKWIFLKDGKFSMETTPTPVLEKTLNEGKTDITLNVVDDKGKAGAARYSVNVKKFPEPEKPLPTYQDTSRQNNGLPQTVINLMKKMEGAENITYKGIMIYGNREFQEGVVRTFEFAKKFSPADYQPLINDTKIINSTGRCGPMYHVYGGIVGVNTENFLYNLRIDNQRHVREAVHDFRHEWGHDHADKVPGLNAQHWKEAEEICGISSESFDYKNMSWIDACNKKLGKKSIYEWHPSELYAEQFGQSALNNLSYVTPEMIDKFNKEFNFSKAIEQ